ncbi:IclR family transcriptional regulator [Nocardia rhizosphaerihabitans]|uniref:Transcriptional regulator n=1 Tax=Nocardia rhizosphaerihabitans TaxID=1691570 RepID=A0ABQ2L222_9NOCA|nr:IclR family transcriptional regulator [Nocardia rhizosphaerihabitans]GGN98237.1 transcriptional regulator [Nocardia rhizosphaerihabitans]
MTVEIVTEPAPEDLWTGSGRAAGAPPTSMIERMTLILDAFDSTTPTLTLLGLAERTGLPRSTVHRILDQMIRLRWLAHTPGGYRLGLRVLELGGLAAEHNELREAVGPLLYDLSQRTGLIGHLAVLDGRDVLFLDRAGGRSQVAIPTRVGGRLPAHCTALGKALLATLEPGIAEGSLRGNATPRTARTIVDRAELHRELARIRNRQGVAVDTEESMPGVGCVAVPIRGRGVALAAISLSGTVNGDRSALDTARLARALAEVAKEAARALAPRHGRPL